MVPGVNRVFAHEGKNYHLQAEDLGVERTCFEARVYEGGTVLWRKRIAYADLVAQKLPPLEQDTALRLLMEKTLNTVQAAIAKGKLA
jgi:hypothetical protein